MPSLKLFKTKELRRAAVSQLIYVVLNVVLAFASLLVIVLFDAPWLAVILIIISKWRVLAVKPRFWWANLRSNLVDFIVGISFVAWLHYIGVAAWPIQVLWTMLYVGWLLFIKPRSSVRFMAIQSLVAIYLGISTIFLIGYEFNELLIVSASFLVMLSAARHLLSNYDTPEVAFYSGLWGLLGAELAWVFHHWVITYPVVFLGRFRLVQPAIIMTLISFLAWVFLDKLSGRSVNSGSQQFAWRDVAAPVIFSLLVILVLLVLFSKPLLGNI